MNIRNFFTALLIAHMAAAFWLLTMALLLPAHGQDRLQSSRPEGHFGVGHERFHPFYRGLKNARGSSCCNGFDCRPTQARWNDITQTWNVMVDGQWRTLTAAQSHVVVTPDVLAKQKRGRIEGDAMAHVCTDASGRFLYCLVPPASGG